MDASDWIALLALSISCAALALEIRRWIESGPRLHLAIMNDAKASHDPEDATYAVVTVTNRGTVPTTIQWLSVHEFDNLVQRVRGRPSWSAVVANPSQRSANLPFEVMVNKTWFGGVKYNDELRERRGRGRLYIGITASHANKTYYKRIMRETAKPDKEI